MFSRKYLFSFICIGLLSSLSVVRADDISNLKATLADTLAKLVQVYEDRIHVLEIENTQLKQELAAIRGTNTITNTGTTTNTNNSVSGGIVITPTTPKSDIYVAVIKQVNINLGDIIAENNLPEYIAIGLFEFIEPNAVFLSLDDGKNPPGVTAFKTKVSYTFDNNLTFTRVGLFDLDYTSQKYRTIFGTNPYIKSVRTRIKNPNYKGKLLTPTPITSDLVNITNSTISIQSTETTKITLNEIKTAYDQTKLLDALKLSDSYIIDNPNDLEVLRIRYRSYYIIGKYENSLEEIKKMENIQGSAFERTIACDAAVIGKIAKKTDVSTYYGNICKKK